MSEKRYFKIFSTRHTIGSQNKYLLLFEQLDKAEKEEDSEIKKNLTRSGIISDFLSADKNYLYRLILKSLNDFHASKTTNLEIKGSLQSIEILFYKGLYQECLKLISKTEVIATECENFQLMIDLLVWKKKASGYSLGLKKAAEVNLLIDKYIILLNNYKRITDLYYRSYFLQANNDKYPRKKVIKDFRNIISQPELKSEKNALSFSARIFYYLIYSNYYYSIDNKKKEFEYLQKLVNNINASKTYANENPLDYLSIYNRLLSIKKHIRSSSFFEDIEVLNDFAGKSHIRKEVIIQRVFIHTNTHELEFHLLNNSFHKAMNKARAIEKELSKMFLEIEPYHMIYFYYLLAITMVFLAQFHKALKFNNRILNEFSEDSRPQVYIRAEVLNAIIHYELKNYSLANSISNKVLKSSMHQKILFPFEKKLLHSLIEITEEKNSRLKWELGILQKIADEIDIFKNSKKAPLTGLSENYEKWVMAKINRKHVFEMFHDNQNL